MSCAFARTAPLLLLVLGARRAEAQSRPASWHASLESATASDTALFFVAMPPGWHITSTTPVTLFDPANGCAGDCTVRSEVFVFPAGPTSGGGGIFIGGADLDGGTPPRYTALLVRADGRYRIARRDSRGERDLVAWTAHDAVRAVRDTATPQRNVLAVSAQGDSVRFELNGAVVATMPREAAAPEGVVGFRLERDVNVHVTTLELNGRNVAPPRPRPS